VPFSRTEPNVPAYEEDPNSPLEVSQQTSATFTLANPSNRVLVLNDPTVRGFNRLQVNGDTGSNYNRVLEDGTEIIGDPEMSVGRSEQRANIVLIGTDSAVRMATDTADARAGGTTGGENTTISGPITQFTLRVSSVTPVDARIRVFALDV